MERVPRLSYTRDWEDPADFPSHEDSEIQNRRDIQSLFTEVRTYLNDVMLPVLEQAIGSGGGGGGEGGGSVSGDFLPLSGGTMRGPLRLYRDPLLVDEAATRSYVDAQTGQVRTDLEGDVSAILQDARRIELLVQDAQGDLASLTVRADGIEGRVGDAEGRISQIQQLADSISFEVSAPQSDGERVWSRIALKIGPEEQYGYVLLDGNVDVSGALSAQALYAACGEVADLAVDRLTTSRRIVRYLQNDRGDDDSIRIQGEEIAFVTASPAEGRVQARSPAGDPLFWPVDVSALPLGSDGWPRSDGERIFTTVRPTEWPVWTWAYTEQVKRRIRFERDPSGVTVPVDTYGAGNADGCNYARVVKSTEGFDLFYITPTGRETGIRMGTGGYVDITGLRRTSRLDLSGWAEGRFYEQLEGSSTVQGYDVEFDDRDRPVRISDSSGRSMDIVW